MFNVATKGRKFRFQRPPPALPESRFTLALLYANPPTGSQLIENRAAVTCNGPVLTLGNYPVVVLDRLSHIFRRPNTRFGHYSTMAKFYYHISRANSPQGHAFMVATSIAAGPRSFDINRRSEIPRKQHSLRIFPPPHDTLPLADTLPTDRDSQLRTPRANRTLIREENKERL